MNNKRLILLIFASLFVFSFANGAELTMKDGRLLNGKLGTLHSIGEDPEAAPTIEAQTIVFLDDNLRRIYVPRFQIANVNQDDPLDVSAKFLLPKLVRVATYNITSIGKFSIESEFDPFGYRRIRLIKPEGSPVDVVQGITELTPEYVKVECLETVKQTKTSKNTDKSPKEFNWDMRISPNSIPSSELEAILQRQVVPGNVDSFIKVARFYIQLQQYHKAVRIMEIAKAQPDINPEDKKKIEDMFQAIKQMELRQRLDEINFRENSGQYKLVSSWLANFPVDGVSSEILQQVRRKIQEVERINQQKQDILGNLEKMYRQLPSGEEKIQLGPVLREIVLNLNPNTLDRMATFEQNLDDESLQPDEHISLAVSGWLMGSEFATTNIAVSLSAYRVRNLIEQYMSEEDNVKRTEIFNKFRMEEASSVRMVSRILNVMTPPEAVEADFRITDDYFRITCRNADNNSDLEYYIQLPPEYDPHRKYPTIVTLHGESSTPQMQIDWWAGAVNEKGIRTGHAGRQGYIVIAPAWAQKTAQTYDYSEASHGAVLGCLHDACRRFSIDTDRVFLTGFSMGATAAWDIAIAHPDLWAGALPIGPRADRFLVFCGDNARYVPTYFVFGQLDNGLMVYNASKLLNRYFMRNFDITLIEYQGRGHEAFQDEILRMLDWMKRRKRNFYPAEFECKSMRTFDNFFWHMEQSHIQENKIVDPALWPPQPGTSTAITSCKIPNPGKSSVIARTAAGKVTIWLNPNIIDFDKKLTILINGKKQTTVLTNNGIPVKLSTEFIEPDLKILLEDVRTRGDRQNPYWARIDITTRKL